VLHGFVALVGLFLICLSAFWNRRKETPWASVLRQNHCSHDMSLDNKHAPNELAEKLQPEQ
jgi:hypothetical protein